MNEYIRKITELRDYCQSEYDKLTNNDYESNIERCGQIRILNRLLLECKSINDYRNIVEKDFEWMQEKFRLFLLLVLGISFYPLMTLFIDSSDYRKDLNIIYEMMRGKR